MSADLKIQALRGGAVNLGTNVAVRLMSLVSIVFLARMLEPADFGVVALVMVLLAAIRLFADLGMGAAVTQSREEDSRLDFHAFGISTVAGTLLFLAVLLAAPVLADLLNTPRAESLLRWMSTIILLETLSVVPRATLARRLRFGRDSFAIWVSECCYMATALTLASMGMGVWSLAWACVVKSTVSTLLLWCLCMDWSWLKPQRPDPQILRRLLRYGLHVTGSGFLSFFNSVWDDVLVGRVLGAAALGFYSKGYSFVNLSVLQINRIFNTVLFPAYAKMQDTPGRLRQAYLKSLHMVSLVTTPIAVGMLFTASDTIPIFLGEKWTAMVPALKILCIMGLVRALSGTTTPLFLAVGRPDLNTRVSIVHTAVMFPLALLFLGQGIEGIAIAVAAAYSVGLVYNVYRVHCLLPGIGAGLVRAVWPSVAGSACMGLGVLGVDLATSGGAPQPSGLALKILVGMLIYGVALFVSERQTLAELIALARSSIKVKRTGDLQPANQS